jgi:serine/threonine-protein kinase
MTVKLVVTAGPHTGKEFAFDAHDTFLVGRSKDAHFQLSNDDPYFSRRHFLVEVNPPRVRVFDLNSRNGIAVNGKKVRSANLKDGDELRAGHTVFRVAVPRPTDPDDQPTLGEENPPPGPGVTVDAALGPLIPGYELTGEIGRGAMGVVHRAVREQDRQPVAIKVITPVSAVSRRQGQRFLREAQILAKLHHRHIVRYLDRGEGNGILYLVMELLDGPDAARMVKEKGPLKVPMATRMMLHALEGLAHAHGKGYVHRDVKPSNLIVTGPKERRTIKVADFGLARAYDSCSLSGLTMQGEVGGTPAFMAPEQVTHYRDVKPTADQYSAAATLYFLLTGRYVFDFNPDGKEHLVQIITEAPVPIQVRRPDIPPGLASVIHRALKREPEERYPDVGAFRTALEPFAG